MPICKSVSACPFFNDKMERMPAMSAMYKRNYCEIDNAKCARFVVAKALGKPKVPIDLFPHQLDRARALIAAG